MKIERLSENKIKCTLTRADLDSHNIVLTEFAYGSEKARAFFHDLMLQAEDEVGFEVEDIPLMIEAIPVNQDCIVLIVTKVADPEELDTRFSRFSSAQEDVYEELDEDDEVYEETPSMEDQSALFGAVKDAVRNAVEGFSKAVEASNMSMQDSFIPLNQSAQKISVDSKETSIPKRTHTVVFAFPKLDDVCGAAQYLKTGFCGDNTLYKDMTGGKYYLVLSSGGQTTEQFTKVCNVLSEYGKRKHNSYALQAYFEEHYLCVIRSNALQTLAVL